MHLNPMAGSNFEDTILYSRIKKRDKEVAEDITSQTFLKSWGHIQNNSLDDFKTLRALFYRVARNAVIDHYRQQSKEQNISLDQSESEIDIVDEAQDPIADLEKLENKVVIQKYLDKLKDEYREVLVLRYLNEMSITEIAEILNKNKGNVRVLSYRALKALREMIEI